MPIHHHSTMSHLCCCCSTMPWGSSSPSQLLVERPYLVTNTILTIPLSMRVPRPLKPFDIWNLHLFKNCLKTDRTFHNVLWSCTSMFKGSSYLDSSNEPSYSSPILRQPYRPSRMARQQQPLWCQIVLTIRTAAAPPPRRRRCVRRG